MNRNKSLTTKKDKVEEFKGYMNEEDLKDCVNDSIERLTKYLKVTEYKNSVYCGFQNNPYYLLIKAGFSEEFTIELNSETRFIHKDSFNLIKEKATTYIEGCKFIRVIIYSALGRLKYDSPLRFPNEILEFVGKENQDFNMDLIFDYKTFDRFFFAPNLPISSLKCKHGDRERFVLGYIYAKNNNFHIDGDVDRLNLEYLSSHFEKYSNLILTNDLALDFFLKEYLIQNNDLFDLISMAKELKKDDLVEKLENYAKINNYLKPDFDEIIKDIKLEQNLMTDANYSDYPTKKFSPIVKDDIGNRELTRKHYSYIKSKINVGDLFFTRYGGEVLLLRVENLGNIYRPVYTFTIEDINSYFCGKIGDLVNLSGEVIDLKKSIGSLYEENSIIVNSLIKGFNISGGKVALYPKFGLFRRSFCNGKWRDFSKIKNDYDTIMEQEALDCFEPYFYIPAIKNENVHIFPGENRDYIVFRKFNINKNFSPLLYIARFNSDLLLDIEDVKCASISPIKYIKDVNIDYVNSLNKTYCLRDVIRIMDKYVVCDRRDRNLRTFLSQFTYFVQKRPEVGFSGFSSDELQELLSEYFALETQTGFYQGWDSMYDYGDGLICLDKAWFKIFYKYARKCDNLEKCSDFNVTEIENRIFHIYNLSPSYCKYFVEIAKRINSFQSFIEVLKSIITK